MANKNLKNLEIEENFDKLKSLETKLIKFYKNHTESIFTLLGKIFVVLIFIFLIWQIVLYLSDLKGFIFDPFNSILIIIITPIFFALLRYQNHQVFLTNQKIDNILYLVNNNYQKEIKSSNLSIKESVKRKKLTKRKK